MQVLIDTHAFVWAVLEDRKLSSLARAVWLDPATNLLISPASLWETAIKVGLGKLALNRPVDRFFHEELAKNSLTLLPILPAHAAAVASLPHHHRDPFDRLLVAQATCEGLPLLSADPGLDSNSVVRLW